MDRRHFIGGAATAGLMARGASGGNGGHWWCAVTELEYFPSYTRYETENCDTGESGYMDAQNGLSLGECDSPAAPHCDYVETAMTVPLIVSPGIDRIGRGAPRINGRVIDRRRVQIRLPNRVATVELVQVEPVQQQGSNRPKIHGLGHEIESDVRAAYLPARFVRSNGRAHELRVGDVRYYVSLDA